MATPTPSPSQQGTPESGGRGRAIRMITDDSLNLASFPLLYQNDFEIVKIAVEKLGYALRHGKMLE